MKLKSIPLLLLLPALMLLMAGCGSDMGYLNDKAAVTTGISTKIEQATVNEPDWEYIGFTHTPVDFQQLMAEESLCASYPPLQPFFNYFIPSHTEGPKKWYLATCLETPVKVFVPAKALLRKGGIRVNTDEVTGGNEGSKTVYDGHNVLSDVTVYFYPSVDVTVFFQHLTLQRIFRATSTAGRTNTC